MSYITKLNHYLVRKNYNVQSVTNHQYGGDIDDLETSARQLYLALIEFDKDIKYGKIKPDNGCRL